METLKLSPFLHIILLPLSYLHLTSPASPWMKMMVRGPVSRRQDSVGLTLKLAVFTATRKGKTQTTKPGTV